MQLAWAQPERQLDELRRWDEVGQIQRWPTIGRTIQQ
jgi:hypothetical protein